MDVVFKNTKNFLKTVRFEEVCKVEFANSLLFDLKLRFEFAHVRQSESIRSVLTYSRTSQMSLVSSSSAKLWYFF